MRITEWPMEERPREKLIKKGAKQLSNAELIAIFLRSGVSGKSAVDLARESLTTLGGLKGFLEADQNHFCKIRGLGVSKFTQIQACLELSRRYLEETLRREATLTNTEDTKQFISSRLRHYQEETFACLFLDQQHRVIVFEELFQGSINSTHIHPRVVVKRALFHNAAGVIFAHNHPSGCLKPSNSDIEATQQLSEALALVEVCVLDHLIVADNQVFSFRERGMAL